MANPNIAAAELRVGYINNALVDLERRFRDLERAPRITPEVRNKLVLIVHQNCNSRLDAREIIQQIDDLIGELGREPEAEAFRSFGRMLREARVAAGISLRGAATLLGTSLLRLSEVERGVRS